MENFIVLISDVWTRGFFGINLGAIISSLGVNHELVDRASKIGFTALAKALNIVYTTKALTIFVAMSPAKPEIGSINVQIYKATVIGTKPIGFFRAFKISSSIFDSVLAARRLREFIITEIIKPLKSNAKIITPRDEMIAPRLIPKKPLVQTSLINTIKFSILITYYVSYSSIL